MQRTAISEHIVKEEFYRSTEKFHVVACWVGLILNLVWFVSDFIVIPEYALTFLIFRIIVSLSSAVFLIFRNALNLDLYLCMFSLVVGISIQNAYMWSVMEVSLFQKHAFAYMVLFIGVGMLVLWELRYSLWLMGLTITANIVFYVLNSRLSPDEFFINGGLITLTVVIFSVFLIRTRYRLTFNEIRSRLELEQSKRIIEQKHEEVVRQKIEIQSQKDSLQEKNREITDSINYARNIQSAFIPNQEKFIQHFSDSFVLFKPKDIVSGDFYWIQQKDRKTYFAAGDCTGHGVPGGFMTMLGLSYLDEITGGRNITDPGLVLNSLRNKIISTLKSSGTAGENKDGMDISFCCIDWETHQLSYSAANNDFYVLRTKAGEKILFELKASRQPCGFSPVSTPFVTETFDLEKGDCIYSFTDGFADQFGGPKGKKFRYREFSLLLTEICHLPMQEQKEVLMNTHESWKGDLDQVDDILILGIKI